MMCKFCKVNMIISQVGENEFEADCPECGYLINWSAKPVTLEQEELPELNVGNYLTNAETVHFVITPKHLEELFAKLEFQKNILLPVQNVEIKQQH